MIETTDRSVIDAGSKETNISNNVEMNEDNSKLKNRYLILMNHYKKEIFLYLLIIIRVVFSAIEKSIPVVSSVPSSGPLFSINSNVQDYYEGQLDGAFHSIRHSEYSFFMYYAPWDAKSQYAAKVISEVADLFRDQISFLAINCWAPGGECREKHASKVQSWPVFLLVNCYGSSIQYRGPINKSHISKFLNTALNPLHRITKADDIIDLLANYDAVIVGYVDFTHFPAGYDIFYKTALKWIDHEPYNEIGFAVVTGRSSVNFGINNLPTFRIYLWNETLEYQLDKVVNSNNLFSWISSNLHQVSMWINLPGVKSNTLSPYLVEGSALLLFTPRNAFRDFNDPYDMLKQIGLEYYNCNNDPWVSQLSKYIQLRRIYNKEQYFKKVRFCEDYLSNINQMDKKELHAPVSVTISKWLNVSKDPNNNVCSRLEKQSLVDSYKATAATKRQSDCFVYEEETCNKNDLKSNIEEFYNDVKFHRIKQNKDCLFLKEADLYNIPIFLDTEDNEELPNITGLACQNNRSLSLLALDSEMYHFIAEKMGVHLLELENKTAVLIIDNEMEYQSILEDKLTPSNIRRFIWDHNNKFESRSFRDNSKTSIYTHKYDIGDKQFINTFVKTGTEASERNLGIASVSELSSDSFISQVMNQNKTVVVLYYSPFCGFCQHAWHIFLYVSDLLKSISRISFVRIDMDYNDMPWQLTMDNLPTITVFPESKSESLTFPETLDITASNLLSFVLSNLNRMLRLDVMVKICTSTKQNSDQQMTCWLEVQRETLLLIEITLKQWRKSHYNKPIFMRRLQLLKSLSLLLNPENKSIAKIKDIVHLILQLNLNYKHQKHNGGLR